MSEWAIKENNIDEILSKIRKELEYIAKKIRWY